MKNRRRSPPSFCVLPFALCLLPWLFCFAQQSSIFSEIDKDLRQLTEITGLKIHHKLIYDLISREKVNEFLKDRIKDAASPEELRVEELALKKFGFVPADFDLAKNTVDLLTEQAAAFYDFHTKKLYITDWTSSSMRQEALTHELAHALADQNFHLERFIRQARTSDDGSLARMAVMEGQASWLMTESVARKSGQSLKNDPAMIESMSRAMESGSEQFPVFQNAPLYIQQTLIFPYSQGMLFQNAVVREKGRQAFAEVFRNPPVSTQQILHPEKYFSKVTPTAPALPQLHLSHGYKRIAESSMGELDHAILLQQYTTKQQSDAVYPHWLGSRYALFENRSEQRVVLAYASEWDSVTVAQTFFELYEQALRKKWKKIEIGAKTEDTFRGIGDDGYFAVRIQGSVVTSVEGLASPPAFLR